MPRDPDPRKGAAIQRMRSDLQMLTARYDDGAMPPGVYAVVAKMQRDIAWAEAREEQER